MLPRLVAVALSCIGVALALAAATSLPVAAAWHLALAAGAMPLIFAAMLHFVPVLTRGRGARKAMQAIPLLALASGSLAALSMAQPGAATQGAAASLALLALLTLLWWTLARARHALGGAHPGLRWYIAALTCLAIALLAVLAMPVFPQARPALRLLHLHLNTLGFIGLTALGTLQVLLPTTLQRTDAAATLRLRSDCWPALAGALLLAGCAAIGLPLLGVISAALLGYVSWRTLRPWTGHDGRTAIRRNGAALSLATANAVLLAVLVLGGFHAYGWTSGTALTQAFVVAFLLPLITGAASQLLPVWLRPGAQGPWHAECRARLGRFAGARTAAFICAGAAAVAGYGNALWIGLAALAAFALQALLAVRD